MTVTREEVARLLERAELEVDDWQLDLIVNVLNTEGPIDVRITRRG